MLRRIFVQLGVSAAFTPPALFAQRRQTSDIPLFDQVPPMLDHILLGCSDLEKGMAFVAQHTGVRAAFGGIHPGRGTQNALLSLGPSHYLEIIAPDPQQPSSEDRRAKTLRNLSEPKLVGWAAHLRGGIAPYAAKLKQAGMAAAGPVSGSRRRPDGKTLQWETLTLEDDASGLLPFFIQWAASSVHPSEDAPSGCQLLRFELLTPDPAALSALAAKLSLAAPIIKAAAPQLRATIKGLTGSLSLNS
jgi:Glyoxalase-like domain